MNLKVLFPIILMAFIFNSCKTITDVSEKRPNVIFILTDDQGYGDLSCLGNPILKTPAIDMVYEESVRFTDFHVSSICTPSRSQLLTGIDACKNGAFAWAYSREMIHPEIKLMPEIFRNNGYSTGHFGKWHLGDNYPYRPIDRGFDESIKHGGASIYQTPDYWDNDYVDDHYEHNGVMKQYTGYCTDVWFDEAKKFIFQSKKEGKPFFVYLPTNAPHGPLIVDQKYSDPYLKVLNKGYASKDEFNGRFIPNEDIAWFYGMISNIDENIAKLDNFLKENSLFENTILIFMTDNGGTAGIRVFNADMRGNKGSLYEGGHRVPFFLRWPNGKLSEPKDVDILTHSQDLLPTLVDLCNLNDEKSEYDGVSLGELIRGGSDTVPNRFLVMQNAQAPMVTKYDAAIMWEKWRLVRNEELYNIEQDPGQQVNLAENRPEILKEMKMHYESWWSEIQGSISRIPIIPVGGEDCDNVKLTCFDWYGYEGSGNVTIQPSVRHGKSANGYWNIEIMKDGEYEIQCYRWPKESETPITAGLPEHKTLTISYPKGKSLPITYTQIQLGDFSEWIEVNDSDIFSSKTFDLKKGKYQLKTTFYDKDKNVVCGAYYTYVKKTEDIFVEIVVTNQYSPKWADMDNISKILKTATTVLSLPPKMRTGPSRARVFVRKQAVSLEDSRAMKE